jgi:hypothetical protein
LIINSRGNTPGEGTRIQSSGSDRLVIDDTTGDISFYEDTGTTPKFFWDASAESLGIGTSAPSTKLHLGGSAPLDSIIRQDSTVSGTNWEIGERVAGKWQIWEDDSDSVVATFTSTGNLLVGTTDDVVWNNSANSAADNGHNLRSDGRAGFAYYNATANANATVNINRTGSDGDLIRLFKSGTAVGSIGTANNDLVIGTADTNLWFDDGANAFNPASSITLGASNGVIDLGGSGRRFKDLYLSGGVYLGGTGAANKLDDYEEGTFTPVMENVTGWSGSSGVDGYYTKIGNTVHVFIKMTSNVALTGTPTHKLTGLPFSSDLGERTSNVSISRMFGIGLTTPDYIAGVSGTEINFSYVNGDNNTNNLTQSGSTVRFTLSATYRTAA